MPRVCVGMQMMARRSDEGELPSLGWIDAKVKKFDESTFTQETHLPHMGWNDVIPSSTKDLFKNLESGDRFYFLHSYYFVPRNPERAPAVKDYNAHMHQVCDLEMSLVCSSTLRKATNGEYNF